MSRFRSPAIDPLSDKNRELTESEVDAVFERLKVPRDKPIVTQVTALEKFYPAEDYHQNYLALHPNQPYIIYNDLPKVAQLKKDFPALYK